MGATKVSPAKRKHGEVGAAGRQARLSDFGVRVTKQVRVPGSMAARGAARMLGWAGLQRAQAVCCVCRMAPRAAKRRRTGSWPTWGWAAAERRQRRQLPTGARPAAAWPASSGRRAQLPAQPWPPHHLPLRQQWCLERQRPQPSRGAPRAASSSLAGPRQERRQAASGATYPRSPLMGRPFVWGTTSMLC